MESCGAELAEGAVVPDLIAELLEHVATNLIAHAEWVGTATEPAEAESSGLRRVAELYRSSASSARSAAAAMRALEDLRPAPHDPELWDGVAFAAWMRRKVELQSRLAELLASHAEHSRRVLEEL